MTKSGQRDTSDNRIVYFALRERPMLAGIRHKTILALGFVLLALVIACSPSDNDAVPTAVVAPAVTPAAAPSSSQPPWVLLASLPVEV